jgi:hypothetical protein
MTYELQFPYSYQALYNFAEEQIFAFPVGSLEPFHYSKLCNRSNFIFDGIYLFKNDSLYNPEIFFEDSYWGDLQYDTFGDFTWFPDTNSYFKKNNWYKVDVLCNKDLWSRFHGCRFLVVHSEFSYSPDAQARFIFISKYIH